MENSRVEETRDKSLNNFMRVKIFIVLLTLLLLTACNTPPAKIQPTSYTGRMFHRYSCEQLNRELSAVARLLTMQRAQLQEDANTDVIIAAVSTVGFLPGFIMLAFTGNHDLRAQYADNLGKQAILRCLAVAREC